MSIRPEKQAELPLYWFREVTNFGDLLSPVILGHFLGATFSWADASMEGKFISTGSVIEFARRGDIVWGTGSKFPVPVQATNLEVLAVRGPRTLSLLDLDERGIALGDPAVLMPNVYPVDERTFERKGVGIIPHYVDQDIMQDTEGIDVVVDLTSKNWKRVVDDIVRCEIVISSSLHGLIVAEAYGVPAVWVQPSNRIFGGQHKFLDYYESTGREGECVPWGGPLQSILSRATPPPDFSEMRASLVSVLKSCSWGETIL